MRSLPRNFQTIHRSLIIRPGTSLSIRPSQVRHRPSLRAQFTSTTRKWKSQPADDPNWTSILDAPPDIVRINQKHGPGLIFLALIPITAFALGTWQVYRLQWKTDLIAKFEDRILKPPLQLPPQIDPDAVNDFDHRRVYATGILRHDQEMLLGPRIHDGKNGYLVITPLDRGDGSSKVLINRGWIPKEMADHRTRPEGLPDGLVTVQGLLRPPFKKNFVTPDNHPELGQFVFPDVVQMAEFSGSAPIWVEETMRNDLISIYDREAKGIPIGRPAEVTLRNAHTQYIFTWYSLCLATSIMFYLLVRKPPSDVVRRVRQSSEWS